MKTNEEKANQRRGWIGSFWFETEPNLFYSYSYSSNLPIDILKTRIKSKEVYLYRGYIFRKQFDSNKENYDLAYKKININNTVNNFYNNILSFVYEDNDYEYCHIDKKTNNWIFPED